MEFYCVKLRKQIEVPESELRKKIFSRATAKGNTTRYQVIGETWIDDTKVKVNKFVSKETFEALQIPTIDTSA